MNILLQSLITLDMKPSNQLKILRGLCIAKEVVPRTISHYCIQLLNIQESS